MSKIDEKKNKQIAYTIMAPCGIVIFLSTFSIPGFLANGLYGLTVLNVIILLATATVFTYLLNEVNR